MTSASRWVFLKQLWVTWLMLPRYLIPTMVNSLMKGLLQLHLIWIKTDYYNSRTCLPFWMKWCCSIKRKLQLQEATQFIDHVDGLFALEHKDILLKTNQTYTNLNNGSYTFTTLLLDIQQPIWIGLPSIEYCKSSFVRKQCNRLQNNNVVINTGIATMASVKRMTWEVDYWWRKTTSMLQKLSWIWYYKSSEVLLQITSTDG
jgi:hypothetical protein